ncbi:hypothetical protein ACFRAQ_19020 [Nocardia sp. NPDC056611]
MTFVLRADGHAVFFGADTLRIAELDDIARRSRIWTWPCCR